MPLQRGGLTFNMISNLVPCEFDAFSKLGLNSLNHAVISFSSLATGLKMARVSGSEAENDGVTFAAVVRPSRIDVGEGRGGTIGCFHPYWSARHI